MKARNIKTGKIFNGKIAEVFVKIGIAKIVAEDNNIEPIVKMSAKEVVVKVLECNSIDELKVFELDDRKTVKTVYNKKLKELNNG